MSDPKFLQAKAIVDFPSEEAKISRFWRDNDIFHKSLQIREGAPDIESAASA